MGNRNENAWKSTQSESGTLILLHQILFRKNCFRFYHQKWFWLIIFFSFLGYIVPLLHMRQLWASTLFLLTLYIFRMQRPTHSRSSRNEATSYRPRAIIWHDLLSCMQRLYIRSGMLCNGWETLTERGQVNWQQFLHIRNFISRIKCNITVFCFLSLSTPKGV